MPQYYINEFNTQVDNLIGRQFRTTENVPIYNYVGGTRIGEIKSGRITAPVYSYIVRDGALYFMFDYSIPGNAPGAYYASYKPGRFKLQNIASQFPGISPNELPQVNITPGTSFWANIPWSKIGIGAGLVGLLLILNNKR